MAWVDFFVHTVLGNILWTLLVLGVGAVTFYFKGRGASWVKPLLYGLAASGLMIGITAGLACISYFSYASQRVKPLVTSDNVETKIRDWLYTFGASVEKLSASDSPGSVFALRAKSGTPASPIIVQRPRELPHYVIIQASIKLGEEEKAVLSKLDERQTTEVLLGLQGEMARAKIGYQFRNPSKPSLEIQLVRRIPITDGLSEDVFMQRFEEVQHDLTLVNNSIVLGLRGKARERQ